MQYRRNAGAVASPVVSSGIYLDAVRPVLTVDSPANGLITNIPTVHIEGSVVDATSPVQVTVNGQRADGIVAGRYMFDAYSLTPGTNLIVIVATDTAGNSNTLTNLCILNTNGDVTPPSLLLDMPLDYQVSGGVTNYFNRTTFGADDLLRVHALASEAGVKTVFTVTNSIGAVQAYNGSISGTDIWARVTLSPGTNTLSWVVFDAAGNQAVSARTVIRDTNFLFQITSPPDLAVQNSNSVTVSGIASANFRAATMTVNGINATITDHGSNVTFATVSGVPLKVGLTPLVAVAVLNGRSYQADPQAIGYSITHWHRDYDHTYAGIYPDGYGYWIYNDEWIRDDSWDAATKTNSQRRIYNQLDNYYWYSGAVESYPVNNDQTTLIYPAAPITYGYFGFDDVRNQYVSYGINSLDHDHLTIRDQVSFVKFDEQRQQQSVIADSDAVGHLF